MQNYISNFFSYSVSIGYSVSIPDNTANNFLLGGAGNDTLNGCSGTKDTANYSYLSSTVALSAQGVLSKGSTLGTDTLIGIERIIGSSLFGDTIDLSGAVAPATNTVTNLATGTVAINGSHGVLIVNGAPLSFTFSQFENVLASNLADSITGDANANNLNGAGGNDTLNGGLGNDTLNGGDGSDTASYADASGSVTVPLTTGQASGAAGIDTLISIENVVGGTFGDTFTGNAMANNLSGAGGNDTFFGTAGNDTLDGGAGTEDTANYSALSSTVTLSAQGVLSKGPTLGTDTLIGIERIIGSSLVGDTIDLSGAAAPAISTVSNLATGTVAINGISGVFIVNGVPLSLNISQFENVLASNLADSITGDANANNFNGGLGNDTLNGGDGSDTASYAVASGSVIVFLTTGLASGAAGNDTLINIENVVGGRIGDTLTGNAVANNLSSAGGNDTFFGTAGNDTLDGGAGTDDTANYSALTTSVTLSAQGVLSKGSTLGTDTLIGIERIIGSSTLGDIVDLSGAIAPATGNITNLTTGSVAINGSSGVLVVNGVLLSFTISQFENVLASNLADSITGDANANSLNGGLGNDPLNDGLGNDTLNSGCRADDTANYSVLISVVSLGAFGMLNKASLGTDALITVENIVGCTLLGDTVDYGGSAARLLLTLTVGQFGYVIDNSFNESIAGDSHNILLTGNMGMSTNLESSLVTVSGTTSPLSLNFTALQFENVTSSDLNDSITANSDNNVPLGGTGNDTFFGAAGNGTLKYFRVQDNKKKSQFIQNKKSLKFLYRARLPSLNILLILLLSFKR